MPPIGDDEFVRRKVHAEMAAVVAGKRLAQFRNAALPGVEGLASGEASHRRGIGDEVGRRQVALARPERDQPGRPRP